MIKEYLKPRQYPLGEIGTLEGEAHSRDVSETVLRDMENYILECIAESKIGLPINSRYVLAMIREIRNHRK